MTSALALALALLAAPAGLPAGSPPASKAKRAAASALARVPAPAASPSTPAVPIAGSTRASRAPRRKAAPGATATNTSLLPRKAGAPPPTAIAAGARPGVASLRATEAEHGTVRSVAGGRAYLDAGSAAGLAPGRTLGLQRDGLIASTCTVEEVAERSATCRGGDPRPGDLFALGPRPAEQAPAVKPLPALLSDEEARARRAALAAAPLALIEDAATPASALPVPYRAEARLIHQSFFASGATAGHEQRLEARIYGFEVAPRWQLWLDASAVYRGSAADQARYQPGASATLEVRELQVASRAPDRDLALAFGRVRSWFTPGATAFDGAQAGWQLDRGEVGVFGGLVPDVATTGVATGRATAGVYGFLDRGDDATLLHGEGRLAMVRSPELGTRVEAEALGHAWLSRRVDVSGQLRLGLGGERSAPAALDAARLDVSARLAEPLQVTAGLRYVGLFVPDPAAPALFPNPARHADLVVSYDVTPEVTVRATGGFARDLTSGLERRYGGPEVAVPRLFGRLGGASAGWLEEGGWVGGRTVWAQAQGSAFERLRLLLRTSLFVEGRPAPLEDAYTLGLAASAGLDLGRFFTAGLTALARGQLRPSSGESQHGLSLLASFTGRY